MRFALKAIGAAMVLKKYKSAPVVHDYSQPAQDIKQQTPKKKRKKRGR